MTVKKGVSIVVSGTKASLKIAASIATLLGSIRAATDLQPQKGTHNPPHLQSKLPPALTKRIAGIK